MQVVNCKVAYIRPKYRNLKEWCEDKNNIYVGRAGVVFIDKERYPKKSSIFANPFKIGKDGDRDKVIEKYREYIECKLKEDKKFVEELIKIKNKNLGCWCHPEKCHADILKELIKKY